MPGSVEYQTLLLDEDDFASNSATKPPTQQSAKAYIATQVATAVIDEDDMATNSATKAPSQQSALVYFAPKASPSFTGDITATNGNIVMSSGKGIDFSATADGTTMGNELLDDYEEGTFSPAYTDTQAVPVSATHSDQDGRYTKIGNVVLFTINLTTTNNAGMTGTDQMRIRNLPFTAASGINCVACLGSREQLNVTAGFLDVTASIIGGTATLQLIEHGDNANDSSVLISQIDATWQCNISGFYIAA